MNVVQPVIADRYLGLLEREDLRRRARTDLITFAQYIHPDKNHPDDITKSAYHAQKFHRVMAAALEQTAMGVYPRLMINVPPRHGKTALTAHTFVPWFMGRNPDKHVILATYNEKFAWDFGRKIRDVLRNSLYRQVFPDVKIKKGAAAADRVELTTGGAVFCVGRGGTATGRGGDLLVIDDPLKNRKEADSKVIREELWTWYTQVLQSRAMTDAASTILVQTRWHEDDLPGRLTDPASLFYNEQEAKYWYKIDFPALAEDHDLLGREKGEALWPGRFSAKWLENTRRTDPRGFEALYQGRPAPEDGVFFDAAHMKEYHSNAHRPPTEELRIYAASDHAVSIEQGRDLSCCMIVGIDRHDDIWVFPDLFWSRATSDLVVETMCTMIRDHKPLLWWAEKGHITKSIGPFLRKRMNETKSYAAIHEITPVADKQTRAQSIKARMAMGKVHFPAFAQWWPKARSEMLKFPVGTHDDFVDTLSMIGLGLMQQATPKRVQVEDDPSTKPGTFGYLKAETARRERTQKTLRDMKGW